jgi:hypothetical protein
MTQIVTHTPFCDVVPDVLAHCGGVVANNKPYEEPCLRVRRTDGWGVSLTHCARNSEENVGKEMRWREELGCGAQRFMCAGNTVWEKGGVGQS